MNFFYVDPKVHTKLNRQKNHRNLDIIYSLIEGLMAFSCNHASIEYNFLWLHVVWVLDMTKTKEKFEENLKYDFYNI